MKIIMPIMALLCVISISGCIAEEPAAAIGQALCDLSGGIWLPEYSECCPKGCPTEPIDFPVTATEKATAERCEVCWLP